MRRSDREVSDIQQQAEILKKCDSVAVAMNDGDYPYVIPMNFGFALLDGRFTLYLHCALEGKKLDLITNDNRVAFEADCSHRIVLNRAGGHCTTEYESVAGRGRAFLLDGAEKQHALEILMSRYAGEDFVFNTAAVPRTNAIRIDVEQIMAKRRFLPKNQK